MSDFNANFWSVYVAGATVVGIIACLLLLWKERPGFGLGQKFGVEMLVAGGDVAGEAPPRLARVRRQPAV